MFGIGIPELIIIFVIALIVLGPDRLPQLARQLARLIAELKKAGEDFKTQMDLEALKDIKHPKDMLKEALETKDTAGGADDWRPAHARRPVTDAGGQPPPMLDQTSSPDKPHGIMPETLPEKTTGESVSKPAADRSNVA